MNRKILEELRDELASSLSGGVKLGLDTVGFGIFTPDGRQISVHVEETGTSLLLLSDAGETWSDLWMDGYVGIVPRDGDRGKLEQICASHGLRWDTQARAIHCAAERRDFADAARRLAACSLAIDGWRVWLENRHRETGVRWTRIVDDVERLASKRHWEFERRAIIPGNTRAWRARGRLARGTRQVAFTFIGEEDPELVQEHMTGWILDTAVPLIFVVPAQAGLDLHVSKPLEQRAGIVPRTRSGTSEKIVETAEQLAA